MPAEPRTIAELARALERRKLTASRVTDQCVAAIERRNSALNSFITVLADSARAQAQQADAEIDAGRYRGPLHGIPISIKDIIDIAGVPTTAASRVREDHVADTDATVVRRLREAGAVLVGKNNLHEFALGTTNEDSAFGPARHPLDENRSPGGSSGGSAAAVAAGMAYASIGTDTGGSVRIPASLCGLVGLKPSFGEIPTDGVVPLSATLDHVGPLCRSVGDARILYDVLRGEPARPAATRRSNACQFDWACCTDISQGCSMPRWRHPSRALVRGCRKAGVELCETVIPHAEDIQAIYVHIALSEAAAYHAPALDSRPDDYTANVRLRLEMGRYILGEDYLRALRGCEVLQAGGRSRAGRV